MFAIFRKFRVIQAHSLFTKEALAHIFQPPGSSFVQYNS